VASRTRISLTPAPTVFIGFQFSGSRPALHEIQVKAGIPPRLIGKCPEIVMTRAHELQRFVGSRDHAHYTEIGYLYKYYMDCLPRSKRPDEVYAAGEHPIVEMMQLMAAVDTRSRRRIELPRAVSVIPSVRSTK
jgi:hypothetical protein